MTILEQMLEGTGSVAILGHIRPDGDCLGSALGLYNYLRLNCPDIRAAVYLEEASDKFGYLKGFDEIRHRADGENYELCVCLDCGDVGRLGEFSSLLAQAKKSLCLDHHVTNTRFAGSNLVVAKSFMDSWMRKRSVSGWRNAFTRGLSMTRAYSNTPVPQEPPWRSQEN